jgi:hypothetical protein
VSLARWPTRYVAIKRPTIKSRASTLYVLCRNFLLMKRIFSVLIIILIVSFISPEAPYAQTISTPLVPLPDAFTAAKKAFDRGDAVSAKALGLRMLAFGSRAFAKARVRNGHPVFAFVQKVLER